MCDGFSNQSRYSWPRNGRDWGKDQVDEFHQHLNSINTNIQFTLELEDANGQGLPFLDTITIRRGTQLEVNVYRKPTHRDRYLDFHSHHPMCHKRSVVSTLLRRAQNMPSTQKGKREETRRVKAVLRDNNYPSSFINSCQRSLSKLPPINRPMASWYYPMCRAFLKELVES